ncbi:interleukin-1 receptor-like 1 isoform X2 [Xiphias gladius]|nr:interleukin-1 receptor-like 1 isoform X2 [Xiphias gladius]
MYSFSILEGEAFYYMHYALTKRNLSDEKFTWYNSKNESLSSDEEERIHYHGGQIFFFNLVPEDSGVYTARHTNPSGKCSEYPLEVSVFNASSRARFLYGGIKNSDVNKKVPCPDNVKKTCNMFAGNFTWYKDFNLLQGNHGADLWVKNTSKEHEGIYTCICTWKHSHKVYNSSGSRMLEVEAPAVFRNTEILTPASKEQFAVEGSGIKLNCTVFCGTQVYRDCHASWHVNGAAPNQVDGYNLTTETKTMGPSQNTFSTAILTIEKVSAEDFHKKFKCIGRGLFTTNDVTLTLKRRESIIPLVIRCLSVLFCFVFAAVLVKCFAIDLALFFRPYLPLGSHNKDAKLYDAFVVYQMQSMDKVTEEALCRFVTQILPPILEEKCGYRLFIQGRDDIPGEDRLQLVEDSINQSRRLMVILTPGSGSGSEFTDQCPASAENSVIGGFDWQVGLHHALVQREMSVILIQLGDTGPQGYTNLPVGLQHLIRKSAPLKWPEGSRGARAWNSRFWKRVRYLMPARPAEKCRWSAVV